MTRSKALAGLAATLALALPGVSAAQSAVAPIPITPAAPRAALLSDSAGEDLVIWLRDIALLGQQYNAVMTRRVDTLMWMIEEPTRLVTFIEAGDKPGARAWAARWAVQARARLAAEVEAFRRLPAEVPAFPASIPLDAEQEARFRSIRGLPGRLETLLTTTGQSSEAYIQLVEAAGSGRPDDLILLSKGMLSLIAAQLEAENALLEGTRINPETPAHHLATAQIETNKALIVLLRHQQASMLEQTSDPEQAAARIRGHAAATRAAAGEMRRTIDLFETRLAYMGTPDEPIPEVFTAIIASLRDSAAVEVRVANELEVLAGAVARIDDIAVEASTLRIEGLANELIALDAARRSLLAGMGV